jgi:hypothetical protein
MGTLGAVLVVCAALSGLAIGCALPLLVFRSQAAIAGMVAAGLSVTLLGSMMAGLLVAGWGEVWLGMEVGVPLGLFLGCGLGALSLPVVAACAGIAAWRVAAFLGRMKWRR